MRIFCLEDFKVEFDKLMSKKSYQSIEKEIISYFFNKSAQELCSGVRLNQSIDKPYIKKRLKGRGGFRVYFLLLVKDSNVYLMFVHPKTGTYGSSNITDESKSYLYKKILEAIKKNDLYTLKLNENKKKIIFNKINNSNK